MAGQFMTCGRGDKEVLPLQQGGLGQGQLPKPDVVIGHSGVESMTCLPVGHSGIESMTYGHSGAESMTCLSVGHSGVESMTCGHSGSESVTCLSVGHSGIESVTCGHSGVESITCSVDGQSGTESLASLTKEVGVGEQYPAKVRARKETQQIPVKAECIAGSHRVPKWKTAQTGRDAGTRKVRRVQDPVGEVETAEGAPEVETAESAPEVEPAEGAANKINQIRDISGLDTPLDSNAELEEVPAHIAELVERSTEGWSHSQQKAIRELLIKHVDIFSKDEFDIGSTDLVEHEIDTGDAKPIRSAPRPMAYGLKEGGKVTIGKLLEWGIIERSCSPWASPVTLVAKKDGTVRLTIDYRRLNAVTKVPASTIPKVQDCVDALEGATIFPLLDSGSAYYQIKMKEGDIPKTAFITPWGHFQF